MLVDLTLAKPPLPKFVGSALSQTLVEISAMPNIGELLPDHRYDGAPSDKEAGAKWLAQRFQGDLPIDRIIVTNGTKSAVLALLLLLGSSGDIIATEELSSLKVWGIPELLKMRHVGIACDEHGIIPDAFQDQCVRDAPKVLFIVPTLNNPETYTTPRTRRLEIADIARKFSVTIIEDDICGWLKTEAPPAIASLAPDTTWFVSGLAKCVGAGLRVGYIVAPDAQKAQHFVSRMKSLSGWHPSPVMAEVATRWINDGTAERIGLEVRAELAVRHQCAASTFANFNIRFDPEGLFTWLPITGSRSEAEVVRLLRDQDIVVRSVAAYGGRQGTEPHAFRICVGAATDVKELQGSLSKVADAISV
ncbi:PLP-dependent aminotransferase family protein [Mesorhizobium delmotii]|uniref:Aminotransferase class I/classII large domain-containing protein n=1 Tax=Mesorhizobium delmotii TaxID=1631247 RepID=A0A2P9AGI1_9HYPH|nr:PLP-dependent aminotransferase family protein [Mesorhizobium delmotii]SJM30224.1 hypothetical protein BQ8482_130123 [Mesorhizobium delmotii]